MDLDLRCIKCHRLAYTCCCEGERTEDGFICKFCLAMPLGERMNDPRKS